MSEQPNDLEERVLQFQMMKLPGQPMGMHMGTSYLVNDLHKRVKELIAENRELREKLRRCEERWIDALEDTHE